MALTKVRTFRCRDCERCKWQPDVDCGLPEHPHCPFCEYCMGRHGPEVGKEKRRERLGWTMTDEQILGVVGRRPEGRTTAEIAADLCMPRRRAYRRLHGLRAQGRVTLELARPNRHGGAAWRRNDL